MKAKGGEFRSKRHLETHLVSDGIIKEEKQWRQDQDTI
jgi:ribosomal protein L19E